MWVARFKLKDDEDIYSPLCKKFKVEFFAVPYTQFTKKKKINLLVGGVISGTEENKTKFLAEIKKDKRVQSIERHHDFILVHAQHPKSREAEAEIKIFYNPQYIRTKPVHVGVDGWEYWELACLDRKELNKIIKAAAKHYHAELFSIKKEILKSVSSLQITPVLTEKQFEAIKLAYKEGYYHYPRKLTIPALAKTIKRSYSTFQENLRKAENKLINYFLKYR
ncbi:helix-turn-helix domain-containing protein [Candidatus Woesearchaeota archaeon]|nr:helix-turn-helix domain-containing protein [Candidatus Woesearchaeota archaeon]